MTEHNGRDHLVTEVINVIVNAVNLQHMDRSKIHSNTTLTQGGLELDSVDLLEVVVAVEHRFGLKVRDAETGRKYFQTIGTIVELVETAAHA